LLGLIHLWNNIKTEKRVTLDHLHGGTHLRSRENPHIGQISPGLAKVLVCAFGGLVAIADLLAPANINLAIFCFPLIVLLGWSRSFIWLWVSTSLFVLLTFAGISLAPEAVVNSVSWVDWLNRGVTVIALVLVGISVHLRIHGLFLRERALKERNTAEAVMRESEARLRLAQTAANIGSWEWNPSGGTYNWSPENFEIFGLDPSAPPRFEEWLANINSEDVGKVKTSIEQCTKDGQFFDVEYRYHHPGRGLRWIHSKARIFCQDSSAARIFGISHDITDQKRSEEALQESLANLESVVARRTSALRRLSARLLKAQEEECRKISRELHDSLGQYLTALKINVSMLACSTPDQERVLMESSNIVDLAITETRTLSYLLHPPLLDEAGFVLAAGHYLDGFANRSGIQVDLQVPKENVRFSAPIELALFRVLQESLTNVHRHSGSPRVDVRFDGTKEHVTLQVRDYGRGMPEELLRSFEQTDSAVGIGLAGMRERISELNGRLVVAAAHPGTIVAASMPVSMNGLD
jgi:signal transduction histidine kinase